MADSHTEAVEETAREGEKTATGFWSKLNEDWTFNLSGMLAYNFLTATAPLALVILAIAGLALGNLSPATYNSYVHGISSHMPAGGAQLTQGALKSLNKSAGVLLVIAIVTAIFAGSRLFVALENCLCVVYRLDNRSLIPQNLMAIGMTVLYAILAPLAFIISSQLSNLLSLLNPTGGAKPGFLAYLGGLIGGVFVTFILFLAMYLVVPNRHHPLRHALKVSWRGALAAAVLLTLYQQLFPLYQSVFLRNAGYGSAAGLAIITLVFLYYAGFITLLGAEVNAWYEGLRPLGATLPELYRQRSKAEER